MKILSTVFLLGAIWLSSMACSVAKTAEDSKGFPIGEYKYSGMDKSGQKIVEGTLTVKSSNERQILGEWELKQIAGSEMIGPQTGKGEFMGSYFEGKIHFNLNPTINDSNVYLIGTIENGRFHGTWSFNAYNGPRATGTFEAVKK